MMYGDEMETALEAKIASALREGVASTPEARERVMRAIRASAPPARGVGDDADVVAGAVPVRAATGRFWRSPGFGLLAAASIAGVIALVRALGVEGPVPAVPGQRVPAPRQAAVGAPASVVAPAAATTIVGDDRTRVARVQFVLVAPGAKRVAVVGDFNDWDVAASPLTASGGVWSGQYDVPFGRHDYAFVVDGERWVRDPNAPQAPADELGGGYSVLVVDENSGAQR